MGQPDALRHTHTLTALPGLVFGFCLTRRFLGLGDSPESNPRPSTPTGPGRDVMLTRAAATSPQGSRQLPESLARSSSAAPHTRRLDLIGSSH